jgi:CDP-diacylglycerol--serine O-phosphatidyltransferase
MEALIKYLRPPDLITILNALFGLGAVFLILHNRNQALLASIFILLGASMDALDGLLARKLKYGILGANLDSFADLITFGLAPVSICYVLLLSTSAAICSALFLICGMLRLARFNILPKTEGFIGMPITAAGVFVALFILSFKDSDFFNLIIIFLAVLSFLMVSRIPYSKIRDKRLVLLFGVFLIFTLSGYYLDIKQLLQSSSIALLSLVTLYILSPFARGILHKKIK